ncbi:MAG: hypothetical protein IIA67_01465 [Planctomycetes bacterium]|nr:hypothetical protein [Planctomycetota bacterium]
MGFAGSGVWDFATGVLHNGPALHKWPELCEKTTKTGVLAAKRKCQNAEVVGAKEVADLRASNYAKIGRPALHKEAAEL